MELENKDPTAQPVSLPFGFLESITGNFSKEQEIGRGGYAVVYKGILPRGSIIAVKKFYERILTGDNDRSFENEASFLMDIEHQNVVQLLGFCAESKGAMIMKQENGKVVVPEERTRILCLEYMCEGGLDKHLSDESSGLEWKERYKIIKGICQGLNFLHGCNIIHRDLKPQNILMNTTMVPKIADFGLSRLLGEQKSHTIVVTSNRPRTPGYMAPEYINKGIISKKLDIFSLGVIIIEILTGSKDDYPYNHQSAEVQEFTKKVLTNWRKRFGISLKGTTPELLQTQQVKQCIDIALECVHPDKEKRPNVSHIIEILNAAEVSCCLQIGDDLQVDHQEVTQEGLPTSGVLREDGLVALNKIALQDHAQAWITQSMMKSAVALPQPQRERVMESLDGSVAALQYQGARNASFCVMHKALAYCKDSMLKDWATTINLGPSVEALEQELQSVKVILESTLGKVIHNLALEDILMVLGELVYDAEDVLDEMEYFRIQVDVLDASQHVKGCAHNLFLNVLPYVHDCFFRKRPYVHDEQPKMRFDKDNVFQRIEHIVEQMKLIHQKVSSATELLRYDWSTAPNIAQSRPIAISESIEAKLYGRESMITTILDDIKKGKHSGEVLTVIPIVGLAGIGKTALAQHIYHSGELKEHFDVRIWTCVSLNFNVNKLIEEIQRSIPKVDDESTTDKASELIGKRLKKKRFLLVLDDIWDSSDEEWKELLVPFRKSQVQGNIIIVTTRFPAQAHKMVQKNDHSIYLQGIEKEEFKKLFLDIVFGHDDQSIKDHEYLLETGFKIVDKLKGSPLAAKTVGRLLKTKLDLVHWNGILESKEWEDSNGKNDIMPALKLSFDYLSSQLQQCFSYCALFPQDYKFERQELINFWIGQEVLYSLHGENKTVEDIGLSCLTKLVNYGFLLENKGGKGERTCYIIHDLLHELAHKVSSLQCLRIDNSQSQVSSLQVLSSIRHLSINIDGTSAKDRRTIKKYVDDFYTLNTRLKVEKLRTLMIFGEHHHYFVKAFGDLFREAKALRLIFLSGTSYDVKYFLPNFYCPIHLRYLRIGSSSLYGATFFNTISRFYHMKVIDVNYCNITNLLPRDMCNLEKLRHFVVRDDTLHSTIIGVGKLKSLQELRSFVVKQENQGFELSQIGGLINLCGSLTIYNLQNVRVKEEADEAKLLLKSHLHELKLHWDDIDGSTNDSTLQEHVLERLKPSSKLLKLSLEGHRGATCPSWLGTNLSIKSLESLCLDGVAWATFPPIGDLLLVNVPREKLLGNVPKERFGNLRRLELCELTMVEKWVVFAPCQLFPFLEVLIIKDCPQLVELSFQHFSCCQLQDKEVNVNLFPRLEKLVIRNCRQLSSFPPIPWNNKAPCTINIEEIRWSHIRKLDCGKTLKSEYGLTINGWGSTINGWNFLNFHNLTELNELEMYKCGFLPLCYLEMLSSLRILRMSCSSNVFPFSEADSHVKYQFPVQELFIEEWNASGMELTQLLTYFPKLSYLHLWHCEERFFYLRECGKQVTWLAVNVRGQRATQTPGLSSSSSANKVSQQQLTGAPGPSSSANKVEQQKEAITEDDRIVACYGSFPELSLPGCNPRLDVLRLTWNIAFHNDNKVNQQQDPERRILLLPPRLQRLDISMSQELRLRSKPGGGKGGGGLQALTSLRWLEIYRCPELLSNYSSSSFSSCFPFPNSLEYLSIVGEVGTEVLLPLSNLTSLRSLDIWSCGDLRGEGLLPLLTQGHLTYLSVKETPNFFVDFHPSNVHEQEIQSCSSKLQNLRIEDVAGFTAAAIRCSLLFSSLTKLEIYGHNMVDCLTEEQEALLFVNSLEDVRFSSCHNLQSLPKRLHGLRNLKRLMINWCEAIQMLHKDVLPSSLEELEIIYCPKIQSLPKDCLPDSLQRLKIIGCPAIQSLPEVDDLPSSLQELDVSESKNRELRSQCDKFINIIPIVKT